MIACMWQIDLLTQKFVLIVTKIYDLNFEDKWIMIKRILLYSWSFGIFGELLRTWLMTKDCISDDIMILTLPEINRGNLSLYFEEIFEDILLDYNIYTIMTSLLWSWYVLDDTDTSCTTLHSSPVITIIYIMSWSWLHYIHYLTLTFLIPICDKSHRVTHYLVLALINKINQARVTGGEW